MRRPFWLLPLAHLVLAVLNRLIRRLDRDLSKKALDSHPPGS